MSDGCLIGGVGTVVHAEKVGLYPIAGLLSPTF